MGITKRLIKEGPAHGISAQPFSRVNVTLRMLRSTSGLQSESSDDADPPTTKGSEILIDGSNPVELWLDMPYDTNAALNPAINMCLLSMRQGETSEFLIPASRLPFGRGRRGYVVEPELLLLTAIMGDVYPEIEVVAPRMVTKYVMRAAPEGVCPSLYAEVNVRIFETHRITRKNLPAMTHTGVTLGDPNLGADLSAAIRSMRVGDFAKVYLRRENRTVSVLLEQCNNPPDSLDSCDSACLKLANYWRQLANGWRRAQKDAAAFTAYADALALVQDATRFSSEWMSNPANVEERREIIASLMGNLGILARELVSLEESLRWHRCAAELLPTHRSLFRVGRALKLLGRVDEALECFRRARQMVQPTTPPAEVEEIDREIMVFEGGK